MTHVGKTLPANCQVTQKTVQTQHQASVIFHSHGWKIPTLACNLPSTAWIKTHESLLHFQSPLVTCKGTLEMGL